MNSHFAGTRPRNEIACADQIEEFLARKPLSPADEFVFHYGDVCRWSPESGRAQPEKKQSELIERNLFLVGKRYGRCKGWSLTHELRPVFLPTMSQETTRQHQPAAERQD